MCVFEWTDVLILDEGVLVDGLDDIFEEDLGGEGVAMVDDWLTVLTVPTVHCGQERQTERVWAADLLSIQHPKHFMGFKVIGKVGEVNFYFALNAPLGFSA